MIVDGMLVVLYPNDHDPPHLHIIDADFTARIAIAGSRIMTITGGMTSAKRKRIVAWVGKHRAALEERWSDLRLGRPVRCIED
jgi:hypothetical protein